MRRIVAERLVLLIIASIWRHAWISLANDMEDHDLRPPAMPPNVTAEVGDDSITVNWTPAKDEPDAAVRGYTVGWGVESPEIMMIALDGNDQNQFVISGIGKSLVQRSSYLYILQEPNLEYIISVRSYNDAGDSEPNIIRIAANSRAHLMTPEKSNYQELEHIAAPTSVVAKAHSSSIIEVSWTDPDTRGAPAQRHYVIRWSVSNNSHAVTPYETSETQRTSLNITALKPFTEYEISVKIVDKAGEEDFTDHESPWSLLTISRTLPSAPTSTPYGFKLIQRSTVRNDLNLTWKSPKEANGVITGYELYFTTNQEQPESLEHWTKIGIIGNVQSYSLQHEVLPSNGRPVYFKMRALNQAGVGPFSSAFVHRSASEGTTTTVVAKALPTISPTTPKQLSKTFDIWILPNTTKDMTKNEGDLVIASCQSNEPKAELSWYFPNGSMVEQKFRGVQRIYTFWSATKKRLQLIIASARLSDSGHYKCAASQGNSRTLVLHIVDFHAGIEPEDNLRCNFEVDFCDWVNDLSSTYEWKRIAAGQTAAPETDNDTSSRHEIALIIPRDHSTLNSPKSGSLGHYAYLQAMDAEKAGGRLISPLFPASISGHACLSLWYLTGSGSEVTSKNRSVLSLYVYPKDEMFALIEPFATAELKSTSQTWKQLIVALTSVKQDFRLVIEATKDVNAELLIALDDIDLMSSQCADQQNSKQGDKSNGDDATRKKFLS